MPKRGKPMRVHDVTYRAVRIVADRERRHITTQLDLLVEAGLDATGNNDALDSARGPAQTGPSLFPEFDKEEES